MTALADALTLEKSPDRLPLVFREFTRHASPRILFLFATLTLGARLYLAAWSWADLYVVLGVLGFWPFLEWMIHVFVLHFRPIQLGRFNIDFPTPKKHRAHHRSPWNIQILFIPLHSYAYTVPLLFLLWIGLSPRLPLAFTGLSFTYLMSLHYEWVHYLVHTRYKPKSAYYQGLWRSHRLHHCKNEHYWLGVTLLAGDHVLGTAPNQSDVPTSDTARTLGIEDTLGA